MEHEEKKKKSQLDTPRAIIISGIIIAVAILITQVDTNPGNFQANVDAPTTAELKVQEEQALRLLENVLPVSEEDHVKGSRNADITIIEYSDFECPYCKQFHATMNRIVDEYDGRVAWVYRHLPIEGLHPLALTEAIASECAAQQKGNEGFWQFADRFYELSPSNNGTDLSVVFPQLIQELGLDEERFNACIQNKETISKVTRDMQNADETGGNGTPWNIVITKDGSKFSVNGAYPYEVMKQMIEENLE